MKRAFIQPGLAHHGFTLIELVVVIVISAIMLGFITMFMTAPMDAYLAQKRRAQFTEDADRLTRTIVNDLRTALPNSVQRTYVGADVFITMLQTSESVTYLDSGYGAYDLDAGMGSPDNMFASIGRLAAPAPAFISIGNLGTTNNDAYELARVITSGVSVAPMAGNESQITLNPAMDFVNKSPSHRAYVVTGPVSYWCSVANRIFIRYQNYSIAAAAANKTNPAMWPGAVQSVLATNVSSCTAEIDPVPLLTSRPGGGLLTLTVALDKPATVTNSGETLTLFEQIPVENPL